MTDQDQLSDLAFIRKTMEHATRYTNVPPGGQLAAGVLGMAGVVTTTIYLIKAHVIYECPEPICTAGFCFCGSSYFGLNLEFDRVLFLACLWTSILIGAALLSAGLSVRRARRHGVSAWNSLARRMFLSQVPLLGVGAVLSAIFFHFKVFHLIPGWWLLCYGLLLFSFHYFTGRDHLIQSVIFLGLGLVAIFLPLDLSLILLGVGFGLVNIVFGIKGLIWRPAEP